MDIVIIGTGNVAQVLARLAMQAGHRILQVAGRDMEKVRSLALTCGAQARKGYAGLTSADLCIMAVTDAAIPKLAAKIRLSSGIIAHTAGSVSTTVLAPCGVSHGVLWPLQSIRANLDRIPEIPWIVDGSDDHARRSLTAFARTLSGTVSLASDQQRRELHLAAVYTSNFINHLVAQAEGYCQDRGLDFELLRPILTETVNRISEARAAQLQTGPAVRGDQATLRMHREMLKDRPEMLAVYRLLTRSIREARP
jgi:predicted short-subunit dehydrogenase-like oxidoreductase (DUF2520 family)